MIWEDIQKNCHDGKIGPPKNSGYAPGHSKDVESWTLTLSATVFNTKSEYLKFQT